MNNGLPSAHLDRWLAQAVERACQHWEARQQASARLNDLSPRTSHAFTIALSREVGTLGTTVAQEVGRRLSWPVYDHALLEQIAREMKVRATLLESVDERQQGWLAETINAFLSMPNKSLGASYVSDTAFVKHLLETVLALGLHGECVIVGRGAAFILPAETTLRVRLVAPVKERVLKLGQIFGVSAKEAARRVRSVDKERVDFVRHHFHKDPADPRQYDVVLNTSRLTVAAEAELIIDGLCHLKSSAAEKAAKKEGYSH